RRHPADDHRDRAGKVLAIARDGVPDRQSFRGAARLGIPLSGCRGGTRPGREEVMRAVVQDKYGTADVLTVTTVDRPKPKPGEVLIRVKAAGVNMADWHLMTGEPTVSRLALGFGGPREKTRGVDVAGIVEE